MMKTRQIWVVSRAVAGIHGKGGLERASADLVRGLRAEGMPVRLVTSAPPYGKSADDLGRILFIPWPNTPGGLSHGGAGYALWVSRTSRTLRGLVGDDDVVHVHGAAADLLARIPGAHTRVVNPHGMEEFQQTTLRGQVSCSWQRWSGRAGAAAADAVIATDERLVKDVQTHLRVQPDKIRVIVNSIDTELFDRIATNETSISSFLRPSGRMMVSVGRLVGNKGYDLLPETLASVRAAGEDVRWVHIGVGPMSEQILRRVDSLDLSQYVTFAGSLEDEATHSLLAKADVFVQPSRFEGSSLTVLEALAHGCPVVATRVGGIPDKIIDGVTGLLGEPSVGSLSALLLRVLRDPGAAADMGIRGRALVDAKFSLRGMIKSYVDLYEELWSARTG